MSHRVSPHYTLGSNPFTYFFFICLLELRTASYKAKHFVGYEVCMYNRGNGGKMSGNATLESLLTATETPTCSRENIYHARGDACPHRELGKFEGSEWRHLRWLDDDSITSS